MQCTAFLGAITKKEGLVLYDLHAKSIKTDTWIKFLKRIHKRQKGIPYLLYFDGLQVHISGLSKEYYKEYGVEYQQCVPYMPDLNPIEMVWAQLK